MEHRESLSAELREIMKDCEISSKRKKWYLRWIDIDPIFIPLWSKKLLVKFKIELKKREKQKISHRY